MSRRLPVELVFNAAHPLPKIISAEEIGDSLLFKETPNTGPFRDLGVHLQEAVVPRLLAPTNVFHQELGNRLAQIGVPRGKQPPFEIDGTGDARARLTLRIAIMPPDVLTVTARLKGLEVNFEDFARQLVALQRPDNHPQVLEAMSLAVGLVESLDHRAYCGRRPARIVPALDLALDSSLDATVWAESNDRELAGVLIRDADYEKMAPAIVESVFGKNVDLNVKTTRELALLDKQGLLCISTTPDGGRFRHLTLMQSMALAYETFLTSYRTSWPRGGEFYDFILGKIVRWVETPDPVFRSSVSNRHAWSLISKELQLANDVAEIRDSGASLRLDESRELFDRLGREWWEKPNFPELLSDSLAEQRQGSRFSFVTDPELRKIIASDLRESEIAYQARAYKASVVLSGSVAEAMLLAALLNSPSNSDSEATLLKATFQELAEKARASKVARDPKAIDLVDQWLRHYRNLVHPGRQKRREQEADENKAAIALRAVKGLAEELAR